MCVCLCIGGSGRIIFPTRGGFAQERLAVTPPGGSLHLAVSWFQLFVGGPGVDVVTVVYRVGSNDFVEFVGASLSDNARRCSSSSHSFLMLPTFN